MDMDMAVHAVATEQGRAARWWAVAGQAGAAERDAGVELGQVAVLAQPRCALDQQGRMHAAVRTMTAQAILARGRVFPQEWPAELGMAGRACLGDRGRCEQGRAWAAMSGVTVAAGDAAIEQRVCRRPQGLGMGAAMTIGADSVLTLSIEYRVGRCVDLVAVAAG